MKYSPPLPRGLTVALALWVALFAWKRWGGNGKKAEGSLGPYNRVDWSLLRTLDYETGKMPDSLSRLDGSAIQISGFTIPLEDGDMGASEFLLIPYSAACVHVAAAPPNMVIRVLMDGGTPGPASGVDPIWVRGKLRINTVSGYFRKPSFSLHAFAFGPFREDSGSGPGLN